MTFPRRIYIMMTYKRNTIFKAYGALFISVIIYIIGNSLYEQNNSHPQIKLDKMNKKIKLIKKNILKKQGIIRELVLKKQRIIKYVIDKKEAKKNANKFKNLVNKSGGILFINDIKVRETKYINLLLFEGEYVYDKSIIDISIAHDLLKDYANIIFKKNHNIKGYSDVLIKLIDNKRFSIKVKK